jgi:hypothetical protein
MTNTFKVYDIGNLGSSRSFVYLGGTYISKVINTDKSKSDFTTFLFASLVGGRNVRIDQATEKDPYIFIDARFYTFKPYSYYVDFSNNITLQTLEDTFASNNVFLKTIIKSIEHSNGDITINTKNIEGDSNLVIHTDKLKNELILKAAEYNLKNTTDSSTKSSIKILTKKSKDTNNNTVFHVNKFIAGNCLKLEQILEFTWSDVFSSSSSSISTSSSISSSSSISMSLSNNSSSSNSSSSSSSDGLSSSQTECCNDCRIISANLILETSFGDAFDFEEVFNTYDRIAQGFGGCGYLVNYAAISGSAQYFCYPEEINDPLFANIPQAGGSPGPYISNANAWVNQLDTSSIKSIYTYNNSPAYCFLLSPEKYENYKYSLVFSAGRNNGQAYPPVTAEANEVDNDLLSFVIAAWEDPNDLVVDPYRWLIGYPSTYPRVHTLSVTRAFTNQEGMGVYSGQSTCWALIYDLNQPTMRILYSYPITPTPVLDAVTTSLYTYSKPGTGLGFKTGNFYDTWSRFPNGTRVSVERNGNIIVAYCTDLDDDPDDITKLGYPITFDLSSDPDTIKFLGPQKYGFGYLSQRFGTFTNNRCEIYFDELSTNCSDCLRTPREFVESNYKFNTYVRCIVNETEEISKIVFPENIYSPNSSNSFWVYDGTTIIDSNNAKVNYKLNLKVPYVDGISLTSMTYTKKVANLVQHDITLDGETTIAFNDIESNINPSHFLIPTCVAINDTSDSSIFDAVEGAITFTLETNFDGISESDQVITEYTFPSDITNGVFIRDKIIKLNSNTFEVYYNVEDMEYDSGNTDGIVKITVVKCLINDIILYPIHGTLELNVQTCCPIQNNDEGGFLNLNSNSSSSSSTSLSSSSSSSN